TFGRYYHEPAGRHRHTLSSRRTLALPRLCLQERLMATFDGVFAGGLTVAVTGLAPEPVDISDPHSAEHLSPSVFATNVTPAAPLDFRPVTLAGALHESSFETYYGRVWFVPLDFGSIISTETLPGMMWNAGDHQVEVISIMSSGDTGLSVDPGLIGSVVLPMA